MSECILRKLLPVAPKGQEKTKPFLCTCSLDVDHGDRKKQTMAFFTRRGRDCYDLSSLPRCIPLEQRHEPRCLPSSSAHSDRPRSPAALVRPQAVQNARFCDGRSLCARIHFLPHTLFSGSPTNCRYERDGRVRAAQDPRMMTCLFFVIAFLPAVSTSRFASSSSVLHVRKDSAQMVLNGAQRL